MLNKTAELFVRKNGLNGIERLVGMANRGASLREIASSFKVSVATAGRLRQTLLKQVYYISDATADWLRYCESKHDYIADRHRKTVAKGTNERPHLVLVHGAAAND